MTIRLLFITALALLGAGCPTIPPATCKSDVTCLLKNGTPGKCMMARDGISYCMFPDSTCPSSWRWGDLSADTIKNLCVDSDLTPKDAGATDGGAG